MARAMGGIVPEDPNRRVLTSLRPGDHIISNHDGIADRWRDLLRELNGGD